MSWWDRLLGRRKHTTEAAPQTAAREHAIGSAEGDPPRWLPADDPGNPFDVAVLDLMATQAFIATSAEPGPAQRSISWRPGEVASLDITALRDRPATPCTLRFPIDRSLPDGLIFTPTSMDQKWVLAWRRPHLIAARSWTGSVDAIADARIEGDTLVVDQIRTTHDSVLTYGALPETFDWLLRCHALAEKLPFPCDATTADVFARSAAAAFSAFGNVIFCAARSWDPPPPSRPLRSDGRVVAAVRATELAALRQAVADGEDVNAPSTFSGYTALHLAIVRGEMELLEQLLALGADPHCTCSQGSRAIHLAVVHKAPPEMFARLEALGVDLSAANARGFTALHAAAEVDNPWAVGWLLDRGLDRGARTVPGHTALHVACALGHLPVAQALVARGADVGATSPDGVALELARREGHPAVAAWLSSLG